MNIECPNCKTYKGLYKEIDMNGMYIVTCCHCNWKSEPMEHHKDLKDIPTIQELQKDWQ